MTAPSYCTVCGGEGSRTLYADTENPCEWICSACDGTGNGAHACLPCHGTGRIVGYGRDGQPCPCHVCVDCAEHSDKLIEWDVGERICEVCLAIRDAAMTLSTLAEYEDPAIARADYEYDRWKDLVLEEGRS